MRSALGKKTGNNSKRGGRGASFKIGAVGEKKSKGENKGGGGN